MRFLILNADYGEFLHWLYAQNPRLKNLPYEEQSRARAESLYSISDFFSSNLRKLGHEAWEIRVNNEVMQKAWALEHNISTSPDTSWHFWLRRGVLPWVGNVKNTSWLYEVLSAQIRYYKPDILINQAMDFLDTRFMSEMKPNVRLLVGQIAAPLPQGKDWGHYHLIISCSEIFAERFRMQGIPSEIHRHGFEPKVLDRLNKAGGKNISFSFVGGLSRVHEERVRMLENLSQRVDTQIWGMADENLPESLRRCYRGPAWGQEMFRILQESKITLNYHGVWAGSYAANVRLYEATGVGAMLLTDWKVNLHEMFEPGKEVVAYRTPEECAELVRYYLEHEEERESIAKAGQQRTLREHTYYQRMQELIYIVRKYL